MMKIRDSIVVSIVAQVTICNEIKYVIYKNIKKKKKKKKKNRP